MNDFLFDLIGFFRTPFNGSDDILNKRFYREPKYNNYPPMVIKIKVNLHIIKFIFFTKFINFIRQRTFGH